MPQGSVAGPTSMMENGMEVMWLNIFSAKLGCALVRPNRSVFEEAQRLETPSATMGTGLASPVDAVNNNTNDTLGGRRGGRPYIYIMF